MIYFQSKYYLHAKNISDIQKPLLANVYRQVNGYVKINKKYTLFVC